MRDGGLWCRRRSWHPVGWVWSALLSQPAWAQACATCFGASDSKMAQGMNMGILTLLVLVALVLGGVAAFFVCLAVRASRASSRMAGTDVAGVAGGVRAS